MPRWLDGVQEFAFTARSGVLHDLSCSRKIRVFVQLPRNQQACNRHAAGTTGVPCTRAYHIDCT